MKKYTLKNGINAIIKRNNNTPRIALVLYFQTMRDEKIEGLMLLLTQLLFQGTKNRTSEQLAIELDENAIDLTFEKKADYVRLKVQCMNEDLNKALEIFEDILQNSTFEEYKKEIVKIKGEFKADLDSAKTQAQDNYYRTIFANHPYGIGRQEILDKIDLITKEDIIEEWEILKNKVPKNIVVVGDIAHKEMYNLLEKHLSFLKLEDISFERKDVLPLVENKVSVVEKEDANQAQIFQGWRFPPILSEDYAAINLMNTILGSSGLSSRLFLELREKQGLAYTVRSVFEPYMMSGCFFVYIATEPKNIKTSLEGFKKEIEKIMTELVSEEELETAKISTIGKRQFYQEVNMLEASLKGYYEFIGLGFDFEEKIKDMIKSVTKEQLLKVAKKYFSEPNALCVLAPKKYLEEAGLI